MSKLQEGSRINAGVEVGHGYNYSYTETGRKQKCLKGFLVQEGRINVDISHICSLEGENFCGPPPFKISRVKSFTS